MDPCQTCSQSRATSHGNLLSPGLPTTVSFASWAPSDCLNLHSLPHHNCLFWCLPSRRCDHMSQNFLGGDCSLFSSPLSTSVSNSRTESHHKFMGNKRLSCPKPTCHSRESLCHQIPTLDLRLSRMCGLVPQPGLPVCHIGHIAYLAMEASISPPPYFRAGTANCFLIHSVTLLFCPTFQLSCSFFVLHVLPLFLSSEYGLSFVTLTLFTHRVLWRKLLCRLVTVSSLSLIWKKLYVYIYIYVEID